MKIVLKSTRAEPFHIKVLNSSGVLENQGIPFNGWEIFNIHDIVIPKSKSF